MVSWAHEWLNIRIWGWGPNLFSALEFLKRHNKICDKVGNAIKKDVIANACAMKNMQKKKKKKVL